MYGKFLLADAMIIDDMRNSNMHGEAEKADFCAVSYTHLTLPTIYSV